MFSRVLAGLLGTAALCSPAWAGDKPLYGPAPDWVEVAPPIDTSKLTDTSPVMLRFDVQHRIEGGTVTAYVDMASRIATPQMLTQAGTVMIPWLPEQGDLTVHSIAILRGKERIDVLAKGEKLTVLRREEQLEQLILTGLQSATMQIEGLSVGDVLEARFSVSRRDNVLKGNIQDMVPLLPSEARPSFARLKVLWPKADALKWRVDASGVAGKLEERGGFSMLSVPLPLPKQPEMPTDAPPRFNKPGTLAISSFADWQAVSKAMAPLYETKGLITPESPLSSEVDGIRAATSDPRTRTALALQVVQDKIRYFANGLAGGYYVPQSPEKTWSVRYGDCKAKTLLLLAILHELGIKAEPVMASVMGNDLVADALPAPGAFDHVLVRAEVGGEPLFLDGTMLGSRLADLGDVPPLRTVLPVRAEGAALMTIAPKPPARPEADVTLTIDNSLGLKLPARFDLEFTLRGQLGAMVQAATLQVQEDQRDELAQSLVGRYVPQPILDSYSLTYDEKAAAAIIRASGIATTPWKMEDQRFKLGIDKAISSISLEADRGRPAWKAIPVATGGPARLRSTIRLKLPDAGKGFALEGDRTLPAELAGRQLKREVREGPDGIVVIDDVGQTGAEIPAADLPRERAALAGAESRELKMVAPADYPPHWKVAQSVRKLPAFKTLLETYAKAIARDPDKTYGYESRVSLLRGIYDYRAALADHDKIIALEPTAEAHMQRAWVWFQLGDYAKAETDYAAAVALDAGEQGAVLGLTNSYEEQGRFDEAVKILDERIAAGGTERRDYMASKALVLARAGKADEALALLDQANSQNPGNADLLNSRCWTKATLNTALDSALKDCTKGIELAETPAAILDSRALVYYRLNRLEDAMADLDAALALAPNQAESLYLRGVVRQQSGDREGAAEDIGAARLISPRIDSEFARYGIKAS